MEMIRSYNGRAICGTLLYLLNSSPTEREEAIARILEDGTMEKDDTSEILRAITAIEAKYQQ